jgi:hypothetical protein
MLVAIGAVIAAALTGKSGPLVVGFAAMTAWSFGRFDDAHWREIHWSFLLLFVPGLLLALGRENRLVAHTAVLALSVWLATLLLPHSRPSTVFILVDGGLAFSVAYIATGLLALDRDWPAAIRAPLPWGAWTFGIMLCCEIGLVLEGSTLSVHGIETHVYPAYGAALISLAALAVLARERAKGALVIIAACVIGLLIPLLFLSTAGGMLVSIAVLVSAVMLIAGGLLTGLRTFVVVGYAVFGVSILILLWRTVGTLLGQSLFFLVAGVVLLGLALGARRLAGWTRRGAQLPSGGTA